MPDLITLVAPDAPIPAAGDFTVKSNLSSRSIRCGLLDNSKGNADHLLRLVVAGVRRELPLASVISLRKDNPARGAPVPIIDQLAAEADFVVSAMAD